MARSNQVVVITGASAGVGRATAVAFARRGASIGLIARGPERLRQAADEVRREGGEALAIPADVANPLAIECAADAVERAFGPIDIWINNAMVSVFSPVAEMKPEEYERVTDVTYLGAVYGTLAALRCMRPRDRGVIVQVGSALAYRSIPLQSAYCAAKHAMAGFTSSLRSELIHEKSGIHLTMVHLPALNTPQFGWVKSRLPRRAQPVPPIYQPELAAKAIVWATEHRRREHFVGVSTLKAVWGQKFVPAWLDAHLADEAYEGQQTDEPESARRDNLWHPAPGGHGAHGEFDDRARSFSLQWWLNTHRGAIALLAGAAALGIAGAFLGRISQRRGTARERPAATLQETTPLAASVR